MADMFYESYEKLVHEMWVERKPMEITGTIGTYIKNERIALGLKQEYICRGLCSVSYYSRIENNIVTPSDYHLQHIFKRLNKPIPSTIVTSSKLDECLHDFVKAYCFNWQEKMTELYQYIQNEPDCHRKFLVELYMANLRRDVGKAKAMIRKVDAYKRVMSQNDVKLFLFALGEFHILTDDYHTALKYLAILFKISIASDVYMGNIIYLYAKIHSRLNQPIKAIYYILQAEKIFSVQCNYDYYFKTQFFKGNELIQAYPERAKQIFYEVLNSAYIHKHHEGRIYCLFKVAQIEKVQAHYAESYAYFQDILQVQSSYHAKIMLEYIDLLIKMGRTAEARSALDQLKLESSATSLQGQLFYYQLILSEVREDKLIANLKNKLLPLAIKTHDHHLERLCHEQLIAIYKRQCDYRALAQEYEMMLEKSS